MMGGAFNMVMNGYERTEDQFPWACMEEFKEALDKMDLVTYP